MEVYQKTKQNINAWEEFGPKFLEGAVISKKEVHYGPCIAGEKELCLLPDLKEKTVLDVGCGSGENCIALSMLGARVVGLEPSQVLYEVAIENSRSASNVTILNDQWGSKKLTNFQVFNILMFVGSSEYLELNQKFYKKLRQLTEIGSLVLLARMHPFWTTLYMHENSPESIRPYFDKGRADTLFYGNNTKPLFRFHYGINDILDRFNVHGFTLKYLSEPKPVPMEVSPFYFPGCYSDEILHERLSKIPMTIIFKFIREW